MSDGIPVEISLMAALRARTTRGDFYTVVQRGDPHSGLILLLWRHQQTIRVFQQERRLKGDLVWQEVRVEASALDGYSARARSRDPDLWVIEVETAENNFPL